MDEELAALRSIEAEPRNAGARINEEVFLAVDVDPPVQEVRPQGVGPGEDPHAASLPEAVHGLALHQRRVVFQTGLEDCGRRHPELVDPDAVLTWVAGAVIKPERVTDPVAVVVVDMSNAEHGHMVLPRAAERGAQFGVEVAAPISVILGVPHVREVEHRKTPVCELEDGAVGVAERMEGNGCGHEASKSRSRFRPPAIDLRSF